jgi:phenylacetate-CoA ligase
MQFEPEIETRAWGERRQADDADYRRQLGYLLARSRFYRDKLAAAGIRTPDDAGGLAEIDRLPFTEKDELRATRSAADPIGAHLCVDLGDLARIFSTSGTTGAPSYVPLTADDLDDWIRISSRSYSASGVRRGDRIVTTYGAGPFVAGVTLDAFNSLGLTHIPVGAGNTDRLLAAVQLLRADTIALTPSYALHIAEKAAERGIDLAASSVKRLLVAGEPGGGEPALRARLEEHWGADVTEAMGIGDIAVSLWGECTGKQGMHFSGHGFVHVELIDPATGEPSQ